MTRTMRGGFASTIIAVALLGALGCDDSPTALVPTPSSLDLVAAMEEAIQDEFKAENTYLRVLADFGPQLPFQNIVFAEERHSQALAWLFQKREMEVPLSQWHLDNVPRFGTLQQACAAAVQAELDNIALYDRLFAMELPGDVRNVFEHNREASLTRHLPAFQACS